MNVIKLASAPKPPVTSLDMSCLTHSRPCSVPPLQSGLDYPLSEGPSSSNAVSTVGGKVTQGGSTPSALGRRGKTLLGTDLLTPGWPIFI